MKTIYFRIRGQFGNQLFQLAFLLSILQKNRGVKILLLGKKLDGFPILPKEFNYCTRVQKMILHLNMWAKRVNSIEVTNEQFLILDDIQKNLALDERDIYISGFFQSINYISIPKQVLRHKLLNEKKKIKQISGSLGIHFRGKDYFVHKINGADVSVVLNRTYYIKALNIMQQHEICKIYIITDDILTARNTLSFITTYNIEYISEDYWEDFCFLQQMEYLIISNSSFAWWAAYFSDAKIIVAPKNWLGQNAGAEYPVGILQGLDWIKI